MQVYQKDSLFHKAENYTTINQMIDLLASKELNDIQIADVKKKLKRSILRIANI